MFFIDEKFVQAAGAGDNEELERIWNWVSFPFSPNYYDPISFYKLNKFVLFAISSKGISEALYVSALNGKTETMQKIFEFDNKILNDAKACVSRSIVEADTETMQKMFEFSSMVSGDNFAHAFVSLAEGGVH